MTKVFRGAMLVLAGILVWLPARADDSVVITGNVRSRTELDKRSFNKDAPTQSFSILRTRINVAAKANENASVFVQFQDSRTLGGQSPSGQDQSGILSNTGNIDVHQAFLQIDELWQGGPGLLIGRFELNLGSERVFGAVGWDNVGRSWEGIQALLKRESFRASAFWLKRLELNDATANRDFDVLGGTLTLPKAGAEFFVAYETDARPVLLSTNNRLDRINLGAFLDRRFGRRLRIISNGVLQLGEQETVVLNAPVSQDISAFLLTAEAIVDFDTPIKPSLSAGFDLASGDDDPLDDDYTAYNNLYYTGHKFRGYMDYFVPSKGYGLLDLIARGAFSPASGWRAGLDVHVFRAAQDYAGKTGEMTKSLGTELDMHASTTRIPGAKVVSGFSVFLPSDEFAGTNNQTGYWGYLMITVGFGQKN